MAAASPLSHPGVRFPPPLAYVAGFTAGWLLHLQWPFAIAGPAAAGSTASVRQLAAAGILAVGLGLVAAALAAFRGARTAVIPNRPAATIVTGGPYRLTRNPMYVALVLLYLGATLALNSWWPVLLLPVVVVVIDRAVVTREERYLAGAFPVEYTAYCRRVRRWL